MKKHFFCRYMAIFLKSKEGFFSCHLSFWVKYRSTENTLQVGWFCTISNIIQKYWVFTAWYNTVPDFTATRKNKLSKQIFILSSQHFYNISKKTPSTLLFLWGESSTSQKGFIFIFIFSPWCYQHFYYCHHQDLCFQGGMLTIIYILFIFWMFETINFDDFKEVISILIWDMFAFCWVSLLYPGAQKLPRLPLVWCLCL